MCLIEVMILLGALLVSLPFLGIKFATSKGPDS
jgi:hypothetical protein